MKKLNLILIATDHCPTVEAYLKYLKFHGFKFRKIIHFKKTDAKLSLMDRLFGQNRFLKSRNFKKFLDEVQKDFEIKLKPHAKLNFSDYCDDIEILEAKNFKDPILLECLSRQKMKTFLYTCGGKVSREALELSGVKFIHIHPGIVPDVRGSDGFLWSLVTRDRLGYSAFYMAEKLDAGPVISRKEFARPQFEVEEKTYDSDLFYRAILYGCDPHLRAQVLIDVLKSGDDLNNLRAEEQDLTKGKEFLRMNEAMRADVLKTFVKLMPSSRPFDIVFYSSNPVDFEWVRSTYQACIRRGLRVALVEQASSLKLLKTKLFVSASTGISKSTRPAACARTIHMPHSIVSFLAAYPKKAFDAFDTFFCVGPHHVSEIKELNSAAHTFEAGYGKMDLLTEEYRAKKSDSQNAQKEILIAPSWGEGNIIQSMGEELIQKLLLLGYVVTLRPHPMFYIQNNEAFLKIKMRYPDSLNFTIESPFEGSRAIFTADVLITDYSGTAFEYAFLRKLPTVFVNVPFKVLNSDWKNFKTAPVELALREKLGVVVGVDSTAVAAGVTSIFRNEIELKSKIEEVRAACLFGFPDVGDRASSELVRMLGECS